MKAAFIYAIAGILMFGIYACQVSGDINGKTVVNNIVLDYENSARIEQVYDGESFEIDLGSGNVDIRGIAGNGINLDVQYMEYKPGDAKIMLKDGKLSFETESGKPAAIVGVSGTIPQSIALVIDTGSGDVNVSNMQSKRDLLIDTGSGNVTVSKINLIKLSADTGSGNVEIKQSVASELVADTGSGSVSVYSSQIDAAQINTGSGNIMIQDSKITHREFKTGSGRVIEESSTKPAD